MDLTAESELGIFVGLHDARFGFAERGQHFLRIVSNGGDDAHAGNDNAFHWLNVLEPVPRQNV